MSIWQFSLINGQYPKNGCQGDKIQPKLQLQKTSFTAAVAILPLLLMPHEKTLQTTFFPAKSSENYSDDDCDDYDDYDNGENPTNDLLLSTKCVRRGNDEEKANICSPLVSKIL